MRDRSEKKKINKKFVLSMLIILVLIPLTIYFCWKYTDRKYYIASILIIIYTLAAFFTSFENKKPQARELVIIAVLCAIAVASRTAFIMLDHVKPMLAFVIIAGISFGAQAGFLTGAVSGFVSNFFFGQGPWTPWQMFAFGIAGFIAGILYSKGSLKQNKFQLAVFGFFTVFIIVGPLLDTCALFTMSSQISASSAAAIYISGIPVNLIHAATVALTLYFVSKPMFEKLERIKLKYGILENHF